MPLYMVNSTTFGGNIHLGRSLLLFAPYAGFGFDKTKTDIDYTFTGTFPTGFRRRHSALARYSGEKSMGTRS